MIHIESLNSLESAELYSDKDIEEFIIYLAEVERKQLHFSEISVSGLNLALRLPINQKLQDGVLLETIGPFSFGMGIDL